MKKIVIENKEKLIKSARIAKQAPDETVALWEAVRERMNVREKSLVKPRKVTHY